MARLSALAFLVGVSLFAVGERRAHADAADISLARELGTEGIKLADAGDCAGAIEKLQKAEALYHAPTILGRLGECQVKVGKLVLGSESLQKVVREDLGPSPKPVFVAAQARAQKVLDATLPRIAKLKISVSGACAADAKVTVDGESVSKAMFGESRPTDPGAHALRATATGCLEATASVTLAEGETKAVALVLVVDPSIKPPEPGETPKETPKESPKEQPKETPKETQPSEPPKGFPGPPKDTAEGGGTPGVAWVLIGVGAVGVVGGTVFGLAASSKKSALDTACPTKSSCPESSRADLDSMKSSATLSTAGFVVGGLGLTIGIIVIASSGKSSSGSAWVQPTLGLGSVGLRGGF